MSWYGTTLTTDTDLNNVHTGVTTLSSTGVWTSKHTVAKERIGQALRLSLKDLVATIDKVNKADGAYSASSNVLTSDGAAFQQANVRTEVDDYVEIFSNVRDLGTLRVASVVDDQQITVKNVDGTAFTFSETQTGVSFRVRQDVLDRIIDPKAALKHAVVYYVLMLVYDDLKNSAPDSDYYAARKKDAQKEYLREWRMALSVLRVDLGNDKIVSPFEEMVSRGGGINLVRGGSPPVYGQDTTEALFMLEGVLR